MVSCVRITEGSMSSSSLSSCYVKVGTSLSIFGDELSFGSGVSRASASSSGCRSSAVGAGILTTSVVAVV